MTDPKVRQIRKEVRRSPLARVEKTLGTLVVLTILACCSAILIAGTVAVVRWML